MSITIFGKNKAKVLMIGVISLLVGAISSIAILFYALDKEKENSSIEFQRISDNQFNSLQKSLTLHSSILYDLGSLFKMTDSITSSNFELFVNPIYERHHEIQAMEWIPTITDSNRNAFESHMKSEGFEGFEIKEVVEGKLVRAEKRSTYYPVYYVVPLEGNKQALGFDLGSNKVRRDALEYSLKTGKSSATSSIRLVQEESKQKGILIFDPVFRNKTMLPNAKDSFCGFVLIVYRMSDLLNQALVGSKGNFVSTVLIDITDSNPDTLAIFGTENVADQTALNISEGTAKGTFSFDRELTIGNRLWKISSYSLPQFESSRDTWLPFTIFLACLFLTFVVTWILCSMSLRTERIQTIVNERTKLLQDYTEKLSSSNSELEDFAYIASHDLREPLRGIHNYSNFLLEDYHGKLEKDGQDKLETLVRLSLRMNSLIDNLLFYSQIGRVDLAVQKVNIADVVNEVLERFEIRIKEENIKVLVSELPSINCDKSRVNEIFHNLILNAIKYNNKSEKTIKISSHKIIEFEDSYVFTVEDNGIGIDDKHFDKIFGIFKRLHLKEQFGGGAGAGLTIAKKIVERHGGSIWLESQIDRGTKFYFTLNENPIGTNSTNKKKMKENKYEINFVS